GLPGARLGRGVGAGMPSDDSSVGGEGAEWEQGPNAEGDGIMTVTYNQAGNANYLAAPQVSQTTTAQKVSQTITVNQQAPSTAARQSNFMVAATASSGLRWHLRIQCVLAVDPR